MLELQYAPDGEMWYSAFLPWTHGVSITRISNYEYNYTTYSTINSPRIIMKLPAEYGKVLIHMYPGVCWRLSAFQFVRWVVGASLSDVLQKTEIHSLAEIVLWIRTLWSFMNQNLIEWDKQFYSVKYLRIWEEMHSIVCWHSNTLFLTLYFSKLTLTTKFRHIIKLSDIF